ncbi:MULTISPECIES: hypothetical protein [unclassified Halorubrum]|uniref:hypothetical protein n=1 Tax=unclassified Halorubrum TaxID=2642239 RepID=UPI000B98932C|nr:MULTISPECIES: hypothetical protein [unclassified Halorubrum]OYR39232.1 hypothetical protein DJ75_17360 [Halorubrum sp. Eb13]OYR53203.1 hypothetical protein DJ73_08465 [Halorubrum sp. Ea1]
MSSSQTPALDGVEFTYDWYERALVWLSDHGYESSSFEGDVGDGDLLLRHDVDLSPRKALEIGRIEADLGFRSTYFFLVSNPLYNVFDAVCRAVIDEIDALGHDVGVHFSTHQHWSRRPSPEELRERVTAERSALSLAAENVCDPVSFHCPPEWVIDRTFDRLATTYEPRFFSEATYVADSGQRWRESHPFDTRLSERVQLLTHPGLWGETDLPYTERVTSSIDENVGYAERLLTDQHLREKFDPPVELPEREPAADR